MKHQAWDYFATQIQQCTVNNLIKNEAFLSTMFCKTYVKQELEYLMTKYSTEEINKLVWEPIESMGEGNNIHQLHHLTKYLEFNKNAKFDNIVEFGAGYGSMCARISRLLKPKRYNIIELPELQGLQAEYLKENDVKNVYWYNSFGDYCKENKQEGLFIALWSLSETIQEVRDYISRESNFRNYLFAYGNNFYDMQNLNYFNEFYNVRPYITWRKEKIEFIENQYYLMGKENE